jgi:arginase
MGAHRELLADPLGAQPVAEDQAVLVDARDLDPPEARYLATSSVRRSAVADLDVATLPEGPLILHIDVDVTDPGDLPGLLVPALGGPRSAQVVAAAHRVLATGRVAVLDIACPWHPATDDSTRQLRADLLQDLFSGWGA